MYMFKTLNPKTNLKSIKVRTGSLQNNVAEKNPPVLLSGIAQKRRLQ